jgi:PPOX class probable F420-dependent enzyme
MSIPAELANARYMSLETFKRSGDGVKTPVWFVESDGRLVVFSRPEAWKVKRIRRESGVRMAPCDIRGNLLGQWHEGTGTLLTDAAPIKAAHRAMRRRYGWQMLAADVGAFVARRMADRAWIEIEVAPTPE